VVALLALVVLLTSLMSQQWDASWGEPGVRLMPRLSDPLVYALWGLFLAGSIAVLVVLFPAELRLRRKKKPDEFDLHYEPPKVTFGVYVLLVLLLALPIGLIVWLYWSGWQPLDAEQGQRQATPPTHIAPLPRAAPPQAPADKPEVAAPGYAWTLFILAALVGLGMLGGGIWILFGDRLERWWYGFTYVEEARRALLNAVEIGLDDLLRDPDPRRAVIVCYRRLEQVLEQHGLPRAPWQTPVEYVQVVLRRFHLSATASAEGRRPFPAVRLHGLTTLFELAKFSTHTLGEREKQTAVEALRTVKATLEELEEGRPLSWAPSAHAVAGNGAPLNTRCAPPSADAVVGRANRVPTT
jgi:heme/copper-type cytochrome/quinol oxidase subunit 2